MVKVGDIVYAKTQDAYSETPEVRPGVVTRVHTAEDGDYAKDREIVSLVLLGGPRVVEAIDMDKASSENDGIGGWTDTYDGTATEAPNVEAEPRTVVNTPVANTPSSVPSPFPVPSPT